MQAYILSTIVTGIQVNLIQIFIYSIREVSNICRDNVGIRIINYGLFVPLTFCLRLTFVTAGVKEKTPPPPPPLLKTVGFKQFFQHNGVSMSEIFSNDTENRQKENI